MEFKIEVNTFSKEISVKFDATEFNSHSHGFRYENSDLGTALKEKVVPLLVQYADKKKNEEAANLKPVIKEVKFVKGNLNTEIQAKFSNSFDFTHLLYFYDDEIRFTENELIGLTQDEALDLYKEKDRAYLQS